MEQGLIQMRQLSGEESDMLPLELRERLGFMPWQQVRHTECSPHSSHTL